MSDSELQDQLQACCELVMDEGLATGHADDHLDLMREVLAQYREAAQQRDALREQLRWRHSEIEALPDDASALNVVDGALAYKYLITGKCWLPIPPIEGTQ